MKRLVLPLLAALLLTACTATPASGPDENGSQESTITRQEAIKAAAGGADDGNWLAVLMEDYSPALEEQKDLPPRDTWIVQRINLGQRRTVFVNAKTGEVYFEKTSKALAPTGTD